MKFKEEIDRSIIMVTDDNQAHRKIRKKIQQHN